MSDFWCHSCNKVVQIEVGMICPECQSEFVEILDRREQLSDEQESSSSNSSLQYRTIELRDLFPLQDVSLYEEQSQQSSSNSNEGQGSGNRQTVLLPYFLQGQHGSRQVPLMLQVRMDNPQNFTNVLNQLLGQLAGRLTNFGDYVPDNALQAILDQLYLQYRPPTQPRTSDKAIASLPVTKLTAENIKDYPEECPVCKCNFEIDEESKELPCSHRYHVACIDRWLMSSNLCPLCRYELEKEEPDGQAEDVDANQDGPSNEPRESSEQPDVQMIEEVIHIPSEDPNPDGGVRSEDRSNPDPRVDSVSSIDSPSEPPTDLDLD